MHDADHPGADLLSRIPRMRERLDQAEVLPVIAGTGLSVWQANGRSVGPRGSWRSSAGGQSGLRRFIKLTAGRHRRFAALTERGLCDVGWVYGRWWYETHVAGRSDLVRFDAHSKRLLLAADLHLDALLRRALVVHSGLLPRRVRPDAAGLEYLAFENIPFEHAERVRQILGQSDASGIPTVRRHHIERSHA